MEKLYDQDLDKLYDQDAADEILAEEWLPNGALTPANERPLNWLERLMSRPWRFR